MVVIFKILPKTTIVDIRRTARPLLSNIKNVRPFDFSKVKLSEVKGIKKPPKIITSNKEVLSDQLGPKVEELYRLQIYKYTRLKVII